MGTAKKAENTLQGSQGKRRVGDREEKLRVTFGRQPGRPWCLLKVRSRRQGGQRPWVMLRFLGCATG